MLLLLAPLLLYKYLGFFSEALGGLFGTPVLELSLVLPLGISFYTFQLLGYIIDVYRGSAKAVRDPVTCLLFQSFFPQIMSGPIGRAL